MEVSILSPQGTQMVLDTEPLLRYRQIDNVDGTVRSEITITLFLEGLQFTEQPLFAVLDA